MAKFFRPAVPIRVEEGAGGIPARFYYRRKETRVNRIHRRWRIREGWWRGEVAREYFELETARFVGTIYRDMLAGNWYLQRIYD